MSPPVDKTPFKDENEPLREAFRGLSMERAQPDQCPDPEIMWDAVAGELTLERIHEIIDHTSICPSCAEEWRLAHEMQRDTGDNHSTGNLAIGELGGATSTTSPDIKASENVDAHVIESSHRFRRAVAPLVALAVAAMLAIVIGLPTKDRSTTPSEYRAGQSQDIESLIPTDQALPRDAFLLRWSDIEGAVYDVLVSGADLQVLTQARELEVASFQVPAEVLAEVEGEIYWQVEATLPDGSTRTSKTFIQKLQTSE